MRASETRFLSFIKNTTQFVMPVNQRRYAWEKRQCRQLWDDILDAGERSGKQDHFLGQVIYMQCDDDHVTLGSRALVFDGQQRLTTVSLMLEALARRLKDDDAPDGFNPELIRNSYLCNAFQEGERRHKLLLKPGDSETLLALLHDRPLPENPSTLILEAFALFEKLIRHLGPDVSALCSGLSKLCIVDVSLKDGEDNPQRIFETMNARGLDLTCWDLIENFILMPLDRERQQQLFQDHLRPIERGFERHCEPHKDRAQFENFICHFLTLKTGEKPRKGKEYDVFKDYADLRGVRDRGPGDLAGELRSSAEHYRAIALGEETDPVLSGAFEDIRHLRPRAAWPFLLRLYRDHADGRLGKHDFAAVARLVAAYVLRRAVCGLKPLAHHTVFLKALREVDCERCVERTGAFLLSQPEGLRFPCDDEFREALITRNMYQFRYRDYVLERLENHGRRETVPLGPLTVEHVMPQGEPLPQVWKDELGPEWQSVWQTWLHTLGNLTWTAFNSEMSNKPFAEKRDASRGFRESPLRLNEDLRHAARWDETAIRARGERLAGEAIDIWQRPVLPDSILASFRKSPSSADALTIDHHPHLRPGAPMHDLFTSFRHAVLAIHPCVREEFKRKYVAYKADTNFVDVVGQKRRLLLVLNARYGALHDPRGIAIDITNRSPWGNGDIQVELEHERQLPYVMDLVRQAFETKHQGGAQDGRGRFAAS